ncbi:hypothetical protein SAMN02744784_01716 [Stenotrophomonas sp. CC120223-11]|nr:hypothetical protein SAMN02744786_2923 [Stenotrophomonas sp. CC120222-04]SNY65945.1 hypothetical protein SAMN02744784_01716 [Stenotrophomonas sp. CC120223-11]
MELPPDLSRPLPEKISLSRAHSIRAHVKTLMPVQRGNPASGILDIW